MDAPADDFDAVWQGFRERSRTLGPTPGAREAWHQGRRHYAVWVLRVACPVVAADVAQRQAHLAGFIDPVPPDQLHVTARVLGFPTPAPVLQDDVQQSRIDAVVAALRADPPDAVRVQVAGRGSFASAAMLPVHDIDGALHRVRQRLAHGVPEQRFGPYRPHITLGAYTADHPVDRVLPALQRAPDRAPIHVVLDTLDLVWIDAVEPAAPWQIAARVALTTPPETPCASS
jgi:2'-5' RNA ligase